MSDRAALLRAILLNPEEDTPRLMYADLIEEEGEVTRAQFIRSHIFASQNPEGVRPFFPARETLDHTGVADPCPELPNSTFLLSGDYYLHLRVPLPTYARFQVRRGFPDSVSITLPLFLDHAKSLFRKYPLTEVEAIGVHPSIFYDPQQGDRAYYGWIRQWGQAAIGSIPAEIFDFLEPESGGRYEVIRGTYWVTDTTDEAWRALSRACVNRGRRRAGLPLLYNQTEDETDAQSSRRLPVDRQEV